MWDGFPASRSAQCGRPEPDFIVTDEPRDRIAAFLDAHHVMSLATCGPDGPHAANLFYARDGFALLWVSDRASRHSAELEADGRVAATIARDYSDYAAIRGLQASGRARRLEGEADRAGARKILEARFPFLAKLAEADVRDSYARAQIYRLDVVRFVLIDNARGFGHKDVLDLADGAAG
jgi:uncharacterized protein YhbP (UPF0306 family)